MMVLKVYGGISKMLWLLWPWHRAGRMWACLKIGCTPVCMTIFLLYFNRENHDWPSKFISLVSLAVNISSFQVPLTQFSVIARHPGAPAPSRWSAALERLTILAVDSGCDKWVKWVKRWWQMRHKAMPALPIGRSKMGSFRPVDHCISCNMPNLYTQLQYWKRTCVSYVLYTVWYRLYSSYYILYQKCNVCCRIM